MSETKRLTYCEGDMLMKAPQKGDEEIETQPACWLEDSEGSVIAAVSKDKDFDKCKAALRHAANATQMLPNLLGALKTIATLSLLHEEDVKWTWRDLLIEAERIAKAAIARATGETP